MVGSLPIAAPEPLTDANVIVDGPYEDAVTRTGSYGDPTAPPGRLCIYGSLGPAVGLNTDEQEGTSAGHINGPPSPYGFAVRYYAKLAGETSVFATWAYTAPQGGASIRDRPRYGVTGSPPTFIATYFVSRYSCIPSWPPSRP